MPARTLRLLAVLTLMLPLLAAAPPSPLDGLVAQLGSRSWVRRQRAERRLRTMGPRAATALRRGLTSPDLEVRRRVRQLLVRIHPHRWVLVADRPPRVEWNEASLHSGRRTLRCGCGAERVQPYSVGDAPLSTSSRIRIINVRR